MAQNTIMSEENTVDERGTGNEAARVMLVKLLEQGFGGDTEKLGLALGRTTQNINDLISGAETIDDDVFMKARGFAQERGLSIE